MWTDWIKVNENIKFLFDCQLRRNWHDSTKETGLSNGVLSSEVFPDVYDVHRKDLKFDVVDKTTSGGVRITIRNSRHSSIVDTSAFDCL